MPPIPRFGRYGGPALLSYGFRPFFLLGALYAAAAVLAWLPMFEGELRLTTALAPLDWHVHEMLYGYVPAVATGFLLTAIPNWTGRLPIQGGPLLVLVVTWIAGRVGVSVSAVIGWLPAAVIDVAFLLLVAAAVAREIVAGRNWRNLKVVALLVVLAAGNIGFHLEAHFTGHAQYGARVGLAVAVMLISLIGGRIVPSFTRNWLVRENPGRLPAPFGRFDPVVLVLGGAALAAFVVAPLGIFTGAAMIAAGLLHLARLARWAGERSCGEPLVLVLHAGYLFVPLGFLLFGAGALELVPPAAGAHAFAGAIGTMTLAVMTRASLGHTGGELVASRPTQAIYAAILVAAAARIDAALQPAASPLLLHLAAAFWAAAFLGFAAVYGPMLLRRRQTGVPRGTGAAVGSRP